MPTENEDKTGSNRNDPRSRQEHGKGGKAAPSQRANPAGRREAQRQSRLQTARKQRRRMLALAGAASIVIVAAIAVAVFFSGAREKPGVETPDDGNAHLAQGIRSTEPYSTNPPTSGAHWGQYAPIGRASLTNEPDEANIHRLEHGYVIINYNCDQSKCPDVYSALFKIWQSYGATKKVVLNYRPQTKETIAVTAWRRLDTMETVDEQRIKKFIDAYLDKGPERAP